MKGESSTRPEPGTPQDWLRHARSDLLLASSPVEGVLLESLCFHAQQAIEKSLKATLVAHAIPVPRTHSIELLIDLLPSEISRTPEILESARLTSYATTMRYPAVEEPVTEEEYRDALAIAKTIFDWALQQIGGESDSSREVLP